MAGSYVPRLGDPKAGTFFKQCASPLAQSWLPLLPTRVVLSWIAEEVTQGAE